MTNITEDDLERSESENKITETRVRADEDNAIIIDVADDLAKEEELKRVMEVTDIIEKYGDPLSQEEINKINDEIDEEIVNGN